MNTFIRQQSENIVVQAECYRKACVLAAKQDDGVISREEQKTLNRINKAVDRFVREIENITGR